MKKIALLILSLILSFLSASTYAVESDWNQSHINYQGPLKIKVYRNPQCNCCHRWMDHLKKHGFDVTDIAATNLADINDKVHLPPKMKSSHTAIIDGYIIEGHVPADDIKRLLIEKPKDVAGLAVPHMPTGVPGAEKGILKQNFIVFQFDKAGKYSVFNSYQVDKNNHYQAHLPQKEM